MCAFFFGFLQNALFHIQVGTAYAEGTARVHAVVQRSVAYMYSHNKMVHSVQREFNGRAYSSGTTSARSIWCII